MAVEGQVEGNNELTVDCGYNDWTVLSLLGNRLTHTNARTHTHTHTQEHARTHTHTQARACAHTHARTHTQTHNTNFYTCCTPKYPLAND
jgi:hypothetical protein